ncbi:MAG: lysophospholipid acyltransferase family protein [Gammaproteobacteria bacterium]
MARKHFLIPTRLIERRPEFRNIGWRLEAIIVRSLVGLIRTMSPESAGRFANFVFRSLSGLFPFTAKIRANLSVAFPDKDAGEIEQLTRNACGHLGNAAVDLALADRLWAERERRVEFVMEEGVDLAGYRGRPLVMITGHFGAWQIAMFVARVHELCVTSVYAPEANPYLREFLLGLRRRLGGEFVSRDGCMRVLTKELRRGNAVGLAADTRMDSGEPIPFFGVPTPSNTTAARLALRHDCDFLPVRAERLPGMRYRITVGRPVRPADPTAPMPEQARQMTQQVLERFEDWIRDNPDQWMCFGRRWPREAYAKDSAAAGAAGEA